MTDRETLFSQHQDWAIRVARSHRRKLPRCVQPDEIDSAALEGLWDACGRWDHKRPFRPYAAWRVRGAIQDYLRSRLPAGGRRTRQRQVAVRVPETCQLFQRREDERDFDMPARPEPLFLDHQDELDRLLRSLPPRTRLMMRLYHLDGWLQCEIGNLVGLCESRVSQILADALDQLHTYWHHRLRETLP